MTGPAGSNPLYDRQVESTRTTINGVPVHLLRGHLPPPIDCPYCRYPCFELNDPDVQQPVDGAPANRGRLTMRAEWSATCVDPAKRNQTAPGCGHPYHLRSHDDCRPGRLAPAFPSGLIVRPPA